MKWLFELYLSKLIFFNMTITASGDASLASDI